MAANCVPHKSAAKYSLMGALSGSLNNKPYSCTYSIMFLLSTHLSAGALWEGVPVAV